ncbi:hypothetical protein [Rhizorhabdus dicambivorans]|uniref:DUF1761 domain-containing protein n=1 Tax=Rhizorhabdus dicambivorans TaxID=1850238 RepID=A0A2A4G0T2_9SPHN|nr:hypothetical protein [Rhizorhabdus dicambivorans]ATE63201.1 hypothetical protein CMV14_01315 [Rhizorhabdus dicambivorans]PCE43379.1 hypothetical protein COO09_06360 [Rhizorhabdus dicambivorans]
MAKTLLGGVFAGVAMFFIGFIFWGTPLSQLAFNRIEQPQSAAIQQALAENLTITGTGTYAIPATGSAAGDILYARGPVAMVHFNTGGFPVVDSASLLSGFVLAIVTGLIIALAMGAVGSRVPDFFSRARIAILFALAATLYIEIGQPIFNHFGYGYWVYLFLSDFIGLAVAGLIIARWFLPKGGIQS